MLVSIINSRAHENERNYRVGMFPLPYDIWFLVLRSMPKSYFRTFCRDLDSHSVHVRIWALFSTKNFIFELAKVQRPSCGAKLIESEQCQTGTDVEMDLLNTIWTLVQMVFWRMKKRKVFVKSKCERSMAGFFIFIFYPGENKKKEENQIYLSFSWDWNLNRGHSAAWHTRVHWRLATASVVDEPSSLIRCFWLSSGRMLVLGKFLWSWAGRKESWPIVLATPLMRSSKRSGSPSGRISWTWHDGV